MTCRYFYHRPRIRNNGPKAERITAVCGMIGPWTHCHRQRCGSSAGPVRRAAVWTGFPAAAVMLVALGHVFADAVGGFDHGVVGRLATVVAAVPEPARSIGVWSIAVLSGLGVAVVAQWPDRWGLCRRVGA